MIGYRRARGHGGASLSFAPYSLPMLYASTEIIFIATRAVSALRVRRGRAGARGGVMLCSLHMPRCRFMPRSIAGIVCSPLFVVARRLRLAQRTDDSRPPPTPTAGNVFYPLLGFVRRLRLRTKTRQFMLYSLIVVLRLGR